MKTGMTIPPLHDPLTYWTVAIDHDDGFNGWPVKSWPSEVFVTIKGRPAVRHWVQFRSQAEAESFLDINRVLLEHRCANKVGFHGFRVQSGTSYWPVDYHEVIELKRPRSLRSAP